MFWIHRHSIALSARNPEIAGLVPVAVCGGADLERESQSKSGQGHYSIDLLLPPLSGLGLELAWEMHDEGTGLVLVAILPPGAATLAKTKLTLLHERVGLEGRGVSALEHHRLRIDIGGAIGQGR